MPVFNFPLWREILEECESGRIGTIGNRVKGNLPWVQIPPPPPRVLTERDHGPANGSDPPSNDDLTEHPSKGLFGGAVARTFVLGSASAEPISSGDLTKFFWQPLGAALQQVGATTRH